LISAEEWETLERQVFKRDSYICQRCGKRFNKYDLSVHHLIPRSEGGSNDLRNLITLCRKCHDIVELTKPTFDEIFNYRLGKGKDMKEKPIKHDIPKDSYVWQPSDKMLEKVLEGKYTLKELYLGRKAPKIVVDRLKEIKSKVGSYYGIFNRMVN